MSLTESLLFRVRQGSQALQAVTVAVERTERGEFLVCR